MAQTTVTPAAQAAPAPAGKPEIKIPAPKKKRRWITVLIVLAVVAALVLWFIVRPMISASHQLNDLLYTQGTADWRDITVSVSGTATVQPVDAYQVTALVRGEILEAPFEEGDTVSEGDLLYRIDTGDLETSIQRAEIAVEQARLSYESLLDSQADSADNLTVRASDAGIISKLYVEAGDTVTAGSPIADIVDRDTVLLTVPFHSVDAAGFSVGQSAEVQVSGTAETLRGTVDSIAAVDEVGTGGTLVRQVTIAVANPGALSSSNTGTASIGGADCAASGAFQNAASSTVTARTSGTLETLTVAEGDRVAEDQVIGRFESSDMDSQIENARLSLESAELSLQSTREQLEDYTITSPISGTVIEKNLKAGDQLNGGDSGAMAVIYDLSQLELQMDVSELDIGQIQPGQTVEITAEALPGQTFTGVVEKVSVNGTTTDGFTTYPVTILLSEYGDLNPGMNVSAHIIVERAENALCVPAEAVNSDGTVLVAGEGAFAEDGVTIADPSKIESRPVTLGRGSQDFVEITSGLEEGETVLLPIQSTGGMPSDGSAAVAAAG